MIDRQEVLQLYAGEEYTLEEAEKLRALGFVMVKLQRVADPMPRYLVADWAPIES